MEDARNRESYPQFYLKKGWIYDFMGVEFEVGNFKMVLEEDIKMVQKVRRFVDKGAMRIHEYSYVSGIMPTDRRQDIPEKISKKLGSIYEKFQKASPKNQQKILESIGGKFLGEIS